jgi:hypothetical protein
MNTFRCLALIAVAGLIFTVTAPKTEAQVDVGVNIGTALTARTVTMTLPLMAVLLTATTARNGFQVVCSLALARGFTAPTISKAM